MGGGGEGRLAGAGLHMWPNVGHVWTCAHNSTVCAASGECGGEGGGVIWSSLLCPTAL